MKKAIYPGSFDPLTLGHVDIIKRASNIVEASKETDFDWLSDAGFHMIKEKVYKTNKHIFAGKGA